MTRAIVRDALDAEWARRYRARIHSAPISVRSVLAELLERPDQTTTELGDLDAVHGQPNASRVLARLEGLGLIRAREEPQPRGGRPCKLWRLTGQGTRLARLAGQ